MSAMDGNSSPRRLFGAIELSGDLTAGRLVWLLSLGVAAVVLEQSFRWPLQMPGHHGIEAMALYVLGRLSCRNAWSATTTAAGATVAAPILGIDHGALMPLFYLLPGVLLDLGFRLRPKGGAILAWLPFIAALAWASKPVLRVLANLGLGMQFGSLRAGAAYPILTHLLFGFVGGLVAVLLWRTTERASDR